MYFSILDSILVTRGDSFEYEKDLVYNKYMKM